MTPWNICQVYGYTTSLEARRGTGRRMTLVSGRKHAECLMLEVHTALVQRGVPNAISAILGGLPSHSDYQEYMVIFSAVEVP